MRPVTPGNHTSTWRAGRREDSPRAEATLAAFAEAGGDASNPEVLAIVAALGEHAPALADLALADPTLPVDVAARSLALADSEASFHTTFMAETADLVDGPELRRALRKLRHRAVVRVALREVLRLADVDQTSAELSALAGAITHAALEACLRSAEARWGPIRAEDGGPVPITVLGVGKLGGNELNLGSDIDLMFFYETDDATVGDGDKTLNEVYGRVAAWTGKAIGDVTEDGFCFRVDLRLRPHGSQGPLARSLASAERYYESFGRSWERAVLLRASPIAGDREFGERLLAELAPFIYPRKVDPTIVGAMVEMVRRSRAELRVDVERDVKLGRGGIREAEFFVQSLQLLWGGQHPALRVPGTVDGLRRLRAEGLVSDGDAQGLEQDWALLRSTEHRIHMRAGYQTHELPADGDELDAFGRSLGFADGPAFVAELDRARARVGALFKGLVDGEDERDSAILALCDAVTAGVGGEALIARVEEVLPVLAPEEAAAHLERLARTPHLPLGPAGRQRTPELGPMLLEEVAQTADPDAALRFLADFFSRMGGPWGYDRLLAEQPRVTRRLVGLFGASATLSSALVGHADAMDHLLVLAGAPTTEAIAEAHEEACLAVDGELPDVESFVAALRRTGRELSLQVGLALVAGELRARGLEVLLSGLADAQIRACFRYAQAETRRRHGCPRDASGELATMAVVAMGKLGGSELGYGGDLDLIFLYDADGDTDGEGRRAVTNSEHFTRIAQRTMRLLSQPDAEGPGYETDVRLRPSGSQGVLVVSVAAFDRYHSASAAPWERQALIRARVVCAESVLRDTLGARFAELAYQGVAPTAAEVATMRGRLQSELAGEKSDRYHPKLGYGGLVDVEFAVQWLQMRHGMDVDIRLRSTLEALRALCTAGHLGTEDAEALEAGYRFFRAVEQSLKLLDESRVAHLRPGSHDARRVARRMGLRARDGQPPRDVLVASWRRRAETNRSIFERLLAPTGQRAPWGTP